MQSTKARGSPKESPQKVSPRPVRQLKINPTENSSLTSSNNAAPKTPKNRSPKVTDRKSPGMTPISEKKRPSKVSELESQISQLENDLKNTKDQLVTSETSKKEAQEEAEQVKKRLADVSLKLDESQKHISALVASREVGIEHRSNESNALSKDEQGNQTELTNYDEIQNMKIELIDCKESESRAKELVRETLGQLEAAKETVDALRLDVTRSSEAYNCIASELERSKERVDFLEGVVSELNALKSDEKSTLNEEEQEVERLRRYVADLKANVMDKEKEIKNITEENEMLKLEIKDRETDKGDDVAKMGRMMEEIEKGKRDAIRVTEQLEAAQSEKTEIEAELRRIKVQSHQWRKAAEAAASMLSPESDESNGKCVERTGSMPVKNNYSPVGARVGSPFLDDLDDGSFKKKNGNVLKKIGVLWKKPQK